MESHYVGPIVLNRPPLQWGHDLAVMESSGIARQSACTTMLQWGHDLAVMERMTAAGRIGLI